MVCSHTETNLTLIPTHSTHTITKVALKGTLCQLNIQVHCFAIRIESIEVRFSNWMRLQHFDFKDWMGTLISEHLSCEREGE